MLLIFIVISFIAFNHGFIAEIILPKVLTLNSGFCLLILYSDNSANSVPMTSPSKSPVSDPAQSARDLFEEFFTWRLNTSPHFATQLGIQGYDDKLGQEINNKILEL